MISGIYAIKSIQSPRKIYIGSAVNLNRRWQVHRNQLLHDCHSNAILQNWVNKYGIEDFVFVAIKICPREKLLEEEQKYINMLQPYFNICLTAGSRAGTRHSPSTKITITKKLRTARVPTRSEALRGKFAKKP